MTLLSEGGRTIARYVSPTEHYPLHQAPTSFSIAVWPLHATVRTSESLATLSSLFTLSTRDSISRAFELVRRFAASVSIEVSTASDTAACPPFFSPSTFHTQLPDWGVSPLRSGPFRLTAAPPLPSTNNRNKMAKDSTLTLVGVAAHTAPKGLTYASLQPVLVTQQANTRIGNSAFLSFLWHHRKNSKAQAPSKELTYYEGVQIVKAFLAYAAKHGVAELQKFTASHVPAYAFRSSTPFNRRGEVDQLTFADRIG
jgi:hypothetical protein